MEIKWYGPSGYEDHKVLDPKALEPYLVSFYTSFNAIAAIRLIGRNIILQIFFHGKS
jgi:hypothetical protein